MSDPTTAEGRAQLRELLANCSRDEWITESPEVIHGQGQTYENYSYVSTREVAADDDPPIGQFDRHLDAMLAVAAVNALPALLDELDQAETELCHTKNNLDQARYGRTQADLAIARVRAALDEWTPARGSAAVFVDEVRAALDGGQ